MSEIKVSLALKFLSSLSLRRPQFAGFRALAEGGGAGKAPLGIQDAKAYRAGDEMYGGESVDSLSPDNGPQQGPIA